MDGFTVNDLSKTYDGRPVFCHVSLHFQSGQIYCLMGASGSGKTTFFRILMGLEEADSGLVEGLDRKNVTAVFQENRLCEAFTPVENVMMVLPKNSAIGKDQAADELCRLLPAESITRPVKTLSGGMKRRTAVCRALTAPFDVVFMDEPFTGLDEETKKSVINYIKEKAAGKLVIISTHQEEDVALLDGILVRLP